MKKTDYGSLIAELPKIRKGGERFYGSRSTTQRNRTAIEVNARFIDFIEPKNSSESDPKPTEENLDKLNKDIEENEEDLPF